MIRQTNLDKYKNQQGFKQQVDFNQIQTKPPFI